MAYLQSVALMVLSVISALGIAVGTVTNPMHAKADPAVSSVPARTISSTKIYSPPPSWLWWVTVALIPMGTALGVVYGRRSARQLHPTQLLPSSAPLEPPASQISALAGSEMTHTTRLSKVEGIEKLVADLHHPDPIQRHQVIWELGQRGDSRAVQPLVELMSRSDSLQRSLILAAVSEIGIRTLQPLHRVLLGALQDDSADVRKNAIRDATRLHDLISPINALLQFAIDDEDGEVRETAGWALKRLNQLHHRSAAIEASLQPSPENSPLLPPPSEDSEGK